MRTVFVSHRFAEFRALAEQIAAQGVRYPDIDLPWLNDGRADERGPRTRSVDTVSRADAVVLLLGLSYSEDDAVDGHTKVSITHEEYLKAIDTDKPVFAYAWSGSDSVEWDPRAQAFLETVMQSGRVVGELRGPYGADPTGDAARILSHVAERLQTFDPESEDLDDDQQPTSFHADLVREMKVLGISDVTTWKVEDPAQQPKQAARLEDVRDGLRRIEHGYLTKGLRMLEQAGDVGAPLWHVDYLRSRLRFSGVGDGDLARLERLLSAYLDVDAHEEALVDSREKDIRRPLHKHRLAATLILRSRIRDQRWLAAKEAQDHGHLQHLDNAIRDAKRAVDTLPSSSDARRQHLATLVMAASEPALDRDADLAEAAGAYLRMYPDDFAAFVDSRQIWGQRGISDAVHSEMTKALERLSKCGITPTTLPSPHQFLAWYRSIAQGERTDIGTVLEEIAGVFNWQREEQRNRRLIGLRAAKANLDNVQIQLEQAEGQARKAEEDARTRYAAVVGEGEDATGHEGSPLNELHTNATATLTNLSQQLRSVRDRAASDGPLPAYPRWRTLGKLALAAIATWIASSTVFTVSAELNSRFGPINGLTALLEMEERWTALFAAALAITSVLVLLRVVHVRTQRQRRAEQERWVQETSRHSEEVKTTCSMLEDAIERANRRTSLIVQEQKAADSYEAWVQHHRTSRLVARLGENVALDPDALRSYCQQRILRFNSTFGYSPRMAFPDARSLHSTHRDGTTLYGSAKAILPEDHWLRNGEPPWNCLSVAVRESQGVLGVFLPRSPLIPALDDWIAGNT